MPKSFLLETQRAFQHKALKQEFTTRKAMQDQIKILLASNFTGDIEPFRWDEGVGYVPDEESLNLLKVEPIPEQQSVLAQLASLFGTLAKLKVMLTDEQKLEVQVLVRSLYELEEMVEEEEYDFEHDPAFMKDALNVFGLGQIVTEQQRANMLGTMTLAEHLEGEKMFAFHLQHPPVETGTIPEPVTVPDETGGFPVAIFEESERLDDLPD
jgi:hypothetical protein